MKNLMRQGNTFSIPIKPDKDGYVGRECPECESYFKIKPSTGLKGKNLPCHCPYCGHVDIHNQFWTKEQIEYAKSVAINQITGKFLRELKKFEHRPDPQAFLSIGIKVEGRPHPIAYYREQKLEQELVCESCTREYSIFGVFGCCPDCGVHNSWQILDANLQVVEKMVRLSEESDADVAEKLIENALEDAISAFDGFGREIVKSRALHAQNPKKAEKISFQNIVNAKEMVLQLYSIDISNAINSREWTLTIVAFQKRHLLAHTMGVADEEYVQKTNQPKSLIGRKVNIEVSEVMALLRNIRAIGKYLFDHI